MSDRPENSSGERRRGGPLGDDVDQSADIRRESARGYQDEDATQQIPTDEATQQIPTRERSGSRGRGGSGRRSGSDTQEFEAPTGVGSRDEESRRGRSIRPAGGGRESGGWSGTATSGGYSTGYSEVLRDREEYLRDIYGGVDWLASFVGLVFTLLCAALIGSVAAIFLLAPLGLQQSLSGGQLTTTALTGFAVVAGVIFLAFLFGGYVSGRMARYDGARNGAMVLLWTVLVAALALVLSGLFGQVISGTLIGGLVGDTLSFGETVTGLIEGLGGAGYVIAGGALLVALLGGMLGGRLGSRYHREIDYTP